MKKIKTFIKNIIYLMNNDIDESENKTVVVDGKNLISGYGYTTNATY